MESLHLASHTFKVAIATLASRLLHLGKLNAFN